MYRVRCRWFANDFFAHFSKVRRLAQRFVLWVVEKHNAFILISVCVDHKDLVRRTDEKWKRAPFRVLLYILWEVKRRVYSFWPHLKTSPTTFFCLILQARGYFIFSPNTTNKYSIQRFCRLLKRFLKRTHNEHCRTRTNRKRTTQTAYLRGLNCFVRLFGEDRDTPPVLMLTPAPRCPVMRFRETARVTCRRKQGAHKSAHSARVTVTPTVTRHRYCHPENNAGKGFS